jgi:hypothetical protein
MQGSCPRPPTGCLPSNTCRSSSKKNLRPFPQKIPFALSAILWIKLSITLEEINRVKAVFYRNKSSKVKKQKVSKKGRPLKGMPPFKLISTSSPVLSWTSASTSFAKRSPRRFQELFTTRRQPQAAYTSDLIFSIPPSHSFFQSCSPSAASCEMLRRDPVVAC